MLLAVLMMLPLRARPPFMSEWISDIGKLARLHLLSMGVDNALTLPAVLLVLMGENAELEEAIDRAGRSKSVVRCGIARNCCKASGR